MEKVIESEPRFTFGENWKRYLEGFNHERLEVATESVSSLLKEKNLSSRTFLDAGNGSGIFSLAAKNMGASVHSFDYDEHSVECAKFLKKKFFPNDPNWKIEQGSVLDKSYMESLGRFDIVYSWGVLHHTGSMWEAIENTANCVDGNGIFCLSIYNDQKMVSDIWKRIKTLYVLSPMFVKKIIEIIYFIIFWFPKVIRDTLLGDPLKSLRNYKEKRGMSIWPDIADWVGGVPFEVASPEAIVDFLNEKGFVLFKIRTTSRHGCNEFTFKKIS